MNVNVGNKATFYMNEGVSVVTCNKCGQEFFMVEDDTTHEYQGITLED